MGSVTVSISHRLPSGMWKVVSNPAQYWCEHVRLGEGGNSVRGHGPDDVSGLGLK
jgi:hypothetical protein